MLMQSTSSYILDQYTALLEKASALAPAPPTTTILNVEYDTLTNSPRRDQALKSRHPSDREIACVCYVNFVLKMMDLYSK